MFNQLIQRKEIPAQPAPLRIRQARHADAAALERLAALDSSQVPRGDVLLAEVGDELWAALSLDDGHAIADPLRPSADAVLMLAAAQPPAAPAAAPPLARPPAPALRLTHPAPDPGLKFRPGSGADKLGRRCACRRGAVSWQSRPSWWWAEPSRSPSGRSPRAQPRNVIYPVTGRGPGPRLRPRRRRHRDRRRRHARHRRGPARTSASRSATRPRSSAQVDGAVFRVHSRCPTSLLGPCTVDYRRDRARQRRARHPHQRRATSACAATAARRGSRTGGGGIDIAGYCGNSLDARAGDGDITARGRVRAAAAVAALGLGLDPRRAPARSLRPRRREHVGQRERPRADAALRRAVHRAGAERARATCPWRAGRDRGARARPAARARRPRGRVPVHDAAGHAAGDPGRGAADPRRGAERGRDRAAAAAGRGRRCAAGSCAGPQRGQPLARRAGAADRRAACAGRGGAFRQSLDLLSDRGLWRMATHLALRPVLAVALVVVALAPVFALALLLQLGIGGLAGVRRGRLRRAVGARAGARARAAARCRCPRPR